MIENTERMWLPAPEFEHLFYIEVQCREPIDVGNTAEGKLIVQPIKGGFFRGERLNGVVLDAGADWSLTRSNGVRTCDTRYVLKTDDGAIITLNNYAVLVHDEAFLKQMIREPLEKTTRFYFREHVRFTTADERYAWLNGAMAFGVVDVRADRTTVCYDAYLLK